MTESEAIKELHAIRPRGSIIPQKRAEALDVAIKALEKQIPKKPTMRHLKHYDSYTDGWCPNCEAYVNEDSGNKYCPNCGQKLDWSDRE